MIRSDCCFNDAGMRGFVAFKCVEFCLLQLTLHCQIVIFVAMSCIVVWRPIVLV